MKHKIDLITIAENVGRQPPASGEVLRQHPARKWDLSPTTIRK